MRLAYILEPRESAAVVSVRRASTMNWKSFKPLAAKSFRDLLIPSVSKDFSPSDIRRLMRLSSYASERSLEANLSGVDGFSLLQDICAAKIAFLTGFSAHPLVWNKEALDAKPVWNVENNRLRPSFSSSNEIKILLTTQPIVWIAPKTGRIGFLHTAMNNELAEAWLRGGWMDTHKANLFYVRLVNRYGSDQLPGPPEEILKNTGKTRPPRQPAENATTPPKNAASWPKVSLSVYPSLERPHKEYNRIHGLNDILRLRIFFHYRKTRIEPGDNRATFAWLEDQQLRTVPRNQDIEKAALQQLKEWGLEPAQPTPSGMTLDFESGSFRLAADARHSWEELLRGCLPSKENEGWTLEIHPSLPSNGGETATWVHQVSPAGESWFHFSVGVVYRGRTIPLLELILQFLRQNRHIEDSKLIRRCEKESFALQEDKDSQPLMIPGPKLASILRHLFELRSQNLILDSGGKLRLPAIRVVELATTANELETDAFANNLSTRLRTLATFMRDNPVPLPIEPGDQFTATLRDYQKTGLAWLATLHQYGLGGILQRDCQSLKQKHFALVFLDEAQRIKNANGKTAEAAFQLQAQARFALTGTPIV